MNFQDIFKKSFLEGFTSMDISAGRGMAGLTGNRAPGLFIFFVFPGFSIFLFLLL